MNKQTLQITIKEGHVFPYTGTADQVGLNLLVKRDKQLKILKFMGMVNDIHPIVIEVEKLFTEDLFNTRSLLPTEQVLGATYFTCLDSILECE